MQTAPPARTPPPPQPPRSLSSPRRPSPARPPCCGHRTRRSPTPRAGSRCSSRTNARSSPTPRAGSRVDLAAATSSSSRCRCFATGEPHSTPLATLCDDYAGPGCATAHCAPHVNPVTALREALLHHATAKRSDPGAQCRLGIVKQTGELGMPSDVQDALCWLQRAADQGHPPAKRALRKMRKMLARQLTHVSHDSAGNIRKEGKRRRKGWRECAVCLQLHPGRRFKHRRFQSCNGNTTVRHGRLLCARCAARLNTCPLCRAPNNTEPVQPWPRGWQSTYVNPVRSTFLFTPQRPAATVPPRKSPVAARWPSTPPPQHQSFYVWPLFELFCRRTSQG